jgi:LacI family transcriptional regulator
MNHLRARQADIARAAGVSHATVDRVLNNRQGVHSRTRAAVLAAAQRLGYLPADPQPAPAVDPVRLHVALPQGDNPFLVNLARQIVSQAAARPDVHVSLDLIEGFDPATLSQWLRDVPDSAQGVGILALDHPNVRDGLRSLTARAMGVVALVSDIPGIPGTAYVGVDNRQAGRLAGFVLGRFLSGSSTGKVALFTGSRSYRAHEEREMGFRAVLGEEFPALSIVDVHEMRDDNDRAFRAANVLLDQHPDLVGIYNIGAGTRGIISAMEGRARSGSIVMIGHEATEENKAHLLAGSLAGVIDQNPRVEARELLNALTAAARGQDYAVIQPRLTVIFRENLPDD